MGETSKDQIAEPASSGARGGQKTAKELFPLVYQQLRDLARRRMGIELPQNHDAFHIGSRND